MKTQTLKQTYWSQYLNIQETYDTTAFIKKLSKTSETRNIEPEEPLKRTVSGKWHDGMKER